VKYLIGLVVLLALTGCSGGSQQTSDPYDREIKRISYEQIAKWEIERAARVAFPPGYTLEELPTSLVNCASGGTLYNIMYIVHGIDAGKNDTYFDQLKEYWQADEWRIQNDNRPEVMFMNATDHHDFLMSIRGGVTGQVAIGASTPCT
jgi:hypothetical protein